MKYSLLLLLLFLGNQLTIAQIKPAIKIHCVAPVKLKTGQSVKLKVELTVQEWEAVLAVIEQSTSPHIQVKSVAAELIKQLQPQIKDDKPQSS